MLRLFKTLLEMGFGFFFINELLRLAELSWRTTWWYINKAIMGTYLNYSNKNILKLTPSKIPFLEYILVLLLISHKTQESNFLLSQQESGKVKGKHRNNKKFWEEVITFSPFTVILASDTISSEKTSVYTGVPGGMCQTSGGCSLW
jgi:hypothetical protein